MSKLVVSVWMTLDGVYDADSMDHWFNPYHSDDRAAYIQETIEAADALLLGRTSYEMLAPYWSTQQTDEHGPASKLNSMRKYVVSSTLQEAHWNNSTLIKEHVIEEITRLKQQPGHHLLIPGSATLVHSLMHTDLIDEYQFLVHPNIIGSGKRFFKDGTDMTKLKLVESKTLSLGVLLLCYQPAKK